MKTSFTDAEWFAIPANVSCAACGAVKAAHAHHRNRVWASDPTEYGYRCPRASTAAIAMFSVTEQA